MAAARIKWGMGTSFVRQWHYFDKEGGTNSTRILHSKFKSTEGWYQDMAVGSCTPFLLSTLSPNIALNIWRIKKIKFRFYNYDKVNVTYERLQLHLHIHTDIIVILCAVVTDFQPVDTEHCNRKWLAIWTVNLDYYESGWLNITMFL